LPQTKQERFARSRTRSELVRSKSETGDRAD